MDGCTWHGETGKERRISHRLLVRGAGGAGGPLRGKSSSSSSSMRTVRRGVSRPLLSLLLLLVCGPLTGDGEKWISVDAGKNEFRVEYCETEVFHAECPEGQVIVMQSAQYGRMKFGRCVDRDYGYVGCQKDVLRITDKWCSGKQKCDVPVPNSAFRSTQPCPKDLKPYFEAEYACVKVEHGANIVCIEGRSVVATGSFGYLAKEVAEKKGLGSAKCPWLIEAKPGQTISITLFDFSLSDWSSTNLVGHEDSGICHVTAVIRETTDSGGVTVCGGDGRERGVYTSVTNAVEVRMLGPKSTQDEGGYYLLKYEVNGCPDPDPPPNAWLKRRGQRAEVGCDATEQKWRISCKGNHWEGVLGNCTAATPVANVGEVVLGSLLMPFEVSLIIITAIAVAIGIIILSIGLICLRWRINKRQCSRREGQKQTPNPQTNTYDGKSHRPTPATVGSQDSFPPPPPPEVDHEMLINSETENEYAYIADMPPPPPLSAAGGAGAGGGGGGGSPDPSVADSVVEVTSGRDNLPQKVFHDFYPTTPTPYEQSPCPSPYHSRQTSVTSAGAGIAPKLLAHECALTAMPDACSGHYGQHLSSPASSSQRNRRSSGRSRLGSDFSATGGDAPTYFELEPEEEVFSFVMHMPNGPMVGHEGPAANVPPTPPPPPTPPIAPPSFIFSKASANLKNGHITHSIHKNNNNNNNSSNNNHNNSTRHQAAAAAAATAAPPPYDDLNHKLPPSSNHFNHNPLSCPNGVGVGGGGGGGGVRSGKVGPKTAPKPKRHSNATAGGGGGGVGSAGNRCSMPVHFGNGNSEEAGSHGKNTL